VLTEHTGNCSASLLSLPVCATLLGFSKYQLGFRRDLGIDFPATKSAFTGPYFFEITACATWNIWKVRNDLIFNNTPANFGRWKVCFQSDLLLYRFRVKATCVQPLVEWIASIFL
jgi:hypothetical protein